MNYEQGYEKMFERVGPESHEEFEKEVRERAKAFCERDEWPGQSLEDACVAFAISELERLAQ